MQEIRDLWSFAGVEVESVSGSKVRCRMPPYFQGVQEFTRSLEPWGAEIDLETTINAGAASVTFTVFGDPRVVSEDRGQGEVKKRGVEPLYMAMLACIVVLQVISMLGGVEGIARVVKRMVKG